MNRLTHTAFFSTVLLFLCIPNLFAQIKLTEQSSKKIWFVARVVNTDPFIVEYLDDWYRHQPSLMGYGDYEIVLDTNPQSQLEKVGKFRVGDIIRGEFCVVFWMDCPSLVRVSDNNRPKLKMGEDEPDMSIPPPIAVNLRRVAAKEREKYKRRGFLISYQFNDKSTINQINIFRDGTMILNSSRGNGMRRHLSPTHLAAFERLYRKDVNSKTNYEAGDDYLKPRISLNFRRYQYFLIENNSDALGQLIAELNKLIDESVRNATYSIHYRWRFHVKDWQFGEVLPLDLVAGKDRSYLDQNWERLSKTMAPKAFFEEAKESSDEMNPNLYRYKDKIYKFEFATCTNRPTGSFACFRAWPTMKDKPSGEFTWVYKDWPADLEAKLRNIPLNVKNEDPSFNNNGLTIGKNDFELHREFYLSLVRQRGWYKEGDYVFADVIVKFR